MTLDEAIKHARQQADTIACAECAKEHRQLAKWLKELRERREQDEEEIHSYKETLRAIKTFTHGEGK